ncbi:ABC transporter permease [Desulfoprunum benzoelyticum]|uniref:ABC-2 type transport system permease protein n=1 Tax=Desulfoprunum benzoelyticum TaxID=1506996 RepID=A0A840V1S9_9BACT|nr:ABC transporter permease [Desulfoprunum benzoelyticum]MBB5349624.1 ABC-2 type transport system permease protein [Desulfoprunum benzoelyticum]MBM9531605.1 ABC transporter permease [Desulfoprunum benzoelyticum]
MSWYRLLAGECRAILTNPAIVLIVFIGVLFYSVLYPLPYLREIPSEQPVVAVNLDGSQLSRRLERFIDATPQVRLAARAASLDEARRLLLARHLAGILVIPEHFGRDLLLGRQPVLALAGDATYFLVSSTVLEGMNAAARTMAAEARAGQLLRAGVPPAGIGEQLTAVRLNVRPVFNAGMGYVQYVIPAVFVLILHQTLVMAAGILTAGQIGDRNGEAAGYWRRCPPWRLLLGRCLVFGLIYTGLALYYFGPALAMYGIARLAALEALWALIVPLLLAATAVGIVLGRLLAQPERVTLVVLLSSMPLVFASGFIWPETAIPDALNQAVQIVPAIPAIKAFILLNQMAADPAAILPLRGQLWLQALAYGLLAWWLLGRGQGLPSPGRQQPT